MKIHHALVGAMIVGATPLMAAETTTSVAPVAIPAPPQGKGQIVFFRPGGMGFALGCSVNENGQKVSSLGAGTYFVMVADPGKHEFSVKTEATDKLALEVEPDETQFAKCRIKMGIMIGRPDLAPATEDDFRKAKKLKMVDADDMGPGPGALLPDQVAAAIAAPKQAPAPAVAETAPVEAPSPAATPVDGSASNADTQPAKDANPAAVDTSHTGS